MRLLIVGASGYIGSPLLESAKVACDAYGTSSRYVTRLLSLRLERPDDFDYSALSSQQMLSCYQPQFPPPDICAREHARAWAMNVTGTSD